jgi:hypothetical protein
VQGDAVGEESTWVTGKALGPAAGSAFAVVADFDVTGGNGSLRTAQLLAERIVGPAPLDFVLHVGDLGYGTGDVSIWNTFMDVVEPLTSALPYHVSIGECGGKGGLDLLWRRA